MTGRPVSLPVVLLVCALLVATAAVMTLQSLALAADGSFYLVRILGTEEVFGPNGRILGNAVRQAPVLIAARAGMTDTHALSILLGLGQLVLPAVVWSVAVVLSRAQVLAFTAVAMTAGICAGTTWFFNVSESVLATPLTVLVGVLLWQPRPWRWIHVVLAVSASTVLVASYEAAAVTGAVLALWAGWRARDSRSRPDRYGGALVAFASALSVVAAIVGAAAGKGPSNARSSLYFVLSADPWPLYVALVGVAAVIFGMSWPNGRVARWALLGTGVACAVVAARGLQTTSVAAFQARGGAALAGLLLLLFFWWLWAQSRWPKARLPRAAVDHARSRWLLVLPVAFVSAMLLANLQGLRGWSRSLEAFRTEVDRANGVRRVEDVLAPGRRQVVWDWTSSSLSLILRGDANAGILVDRDPSFVPFPPPSARGQLADDYAWDP